MRRWNIRIYKLVTVINPEHSDQNASVRFAVQSVREHLEREVVGQSHLVQRMLMALLCGGHVLVEGAPGLAKTRAIKALAGVIEGDFHRIQFTPDLLPSDVTGTEIYRLADGSFIFSPARSSTT